MIRIPALSDASLQTTLAWMSKMSALGLSFHPDDSPETVFSGGLRAPVRTFTDEEVPVVRDIIARIHEAGIDPCEVWLDMDRMNDLKIDRNCHNAGRVVWASQNHEDARELADLEEKYGAEVSA